MQRRFNLLLPVVAVCLFPSLSTGSEQLNQRLARIFNSNAFVAKRFGPARWIREGAAFTTLEPSAADPTAQDIVEYDTASGKRSVLVSSTQLTPKDTKKPLDIEDLRVGQIVEQIAHIHRVQTDVADEHARRLLGARPGFRKPQETGR